MAIKKTDGKEYRNLRGVWTRLNEKHPATDSSYVSEFKGLGKAGFASLGGMSALGSAMLLVMVGMHDVGDVYGTDYNRIVDNELSQSTQQIGMENTDGSGTFVTYNAEQENWRVYQTQRDNDGHLELTFIEDESMASQYIELLMQPYLSADMQSAEQGTFFEPTNYYTLETVSGLFEMDDELMRVSMDTTPAIVHGENLMAELSQMQSLLSEAEIAMANDTSDDYGFDAGSITHTYEAPYTTGRDLAVIGAASVFVTFVLGAAGALALGGMGVGLEGVQRSVYNRRRKRENILKR